MEIKLVDPKTLDFKGKNASLTFKTDTSGVGKFNTEAVEIKGPGEYEIMGIQIQGFSTDGNTNYRIRMDGINSVVICGKVNARQEEALSDIDVLLIPGDKKFAELVLKFSPKIIVIYNTPEPGEFMRDIGKSEISPTKKVVVKKEGLPQELEVVWLA